MFVNVYANSKKWLNFVKFVEMMFKNVKISLHLVNINKYIFRCL